MNALNQMVRNVVALVWRVLLLPIRPLARLLGRVGALVFGHWQPPLWLGFVGQVGALVGSLAARHAFIAALALLFGLGALLVPRLAKWHSFGKPGQVQGVRPDKIASSQAGVSIAAPEPTPWDGDGKIRPAVITFSLSAAPLIRIGKEAQDVTMTPALPGKWLWREATRLEFTPNADWPIGQRYKVYLGPKTLAPHVVLPELPLVFDTPDFDMKVRDASFYQDPSQLTLRKGLFEVKFSHPVQAESFEKNLKLVVEGDAADLFASAAASKSKLRVTYDKFRLNATVHTDALRIPAQTTALSLVIGSGVQAERGGSASKDEVTRALSIPGINSLDIAEMKQLIVTNANGEPENVLQLTTAMAVNEKEMARAISAWQLPAKRKSGDGQESSAWDDPEQVTPEVLAQSSPVKLELTPAERENTEIHSFRFAAEAGRYLFVRVKKGLKSSGGYQLGATREEVFRLKRSAPELAIMSKGSLLAMSGEKKLPLLIRDVPAVNLEIGRLLPQQLQHLVQQSAGEMTRPEFYNGISADSLTERFQKTLTIAQKPGKTQYESVDFADYLKNDAQDRRGIFLLSVQAFDPKAEPLETRINENGEEEQVPRRRHKKRRHVPADEEAETDQDQVDYRQMRDTRLVIVTDLALIAKQARDGTRDVFVQSIHDGQPVPAAQVEVWGQNGVVLLSQATDADGHTRLPSLASFVREKAPSVLVVKKGGDLSFLPLNRPDRVLDLSRFDVGGVHSSGLPNQMQGYLFSDRGIYRPGDTMNIGVVVKTAGWAQKLVDLPVEAEVIDARGLVVRRHKFKLGAAGMAEFSHATQDSSPTGNYTINLNLARDTGNSSPGASEAAALQLGTLSVKVQEFMPDRTKVSARLSSESEQGWISPADLALNVNVQNLFGTPAQNRRVEGKLTLSPAIPAFHSLPDYQFFDPRHLKEQQQADLAKVETDDKGNATLALALDRYENATYQMHVLVKAFEPEGGRSVAAEASALVSDRPFLLGYKSDGDLSYVNRNSVRYLNLLAVNPKLKPVASGKLRLVRLEHKVLSVLTLQSNGLYKYESKTSERDLNEVPIDIAANGYKLALATQTPGSFAYEVRDGSGLRLMRVDYSVAGSGNVSRSLERNAELQMTLNKKDYNPGDEIEISIRAPYVGTGLITIERDHVVAHKWFRSSDTASVQKISLPKDFEGNGYVSVQFARDLASNEIYMSPLSYGVLPFATGLGRRSNTLTLQAPEKVKPGQQVKINLTAKQPGRALVFAVDEGILQVARYTAPDPLKYFFQKKALEVTTSQTLDLVLPEFKKLMAGAAPGGDAAGVLGKHLNPFKRKTDKPVVYWSGLVELNGSREFTYTVPENFNGSLRIMAIVVNDDTAAMAQSATAVRGDLVLLPNVPVAITPGDEVEIGLGVANNTVGSGKDAAVNINLSLSPGLELVGPKDVQLKISERGEATSKFVVRARAGKEAQLGSASVIFTAQLRQGKLEARARLSTDVSVRPASAYVTLVQTGAFQGSGEIKAQGDFYPNYQRSSAAISASPWAFTSGLIQYLDVYPYGCSEQITSQVFPAVVIGSQLELAKQLLRGTRGAGELEWPDPRKTLDRYLTEIRARQNAEGGFGMWPGSDGDLFATAYVVNLLLEAKEHKLTVPSDVLQRANLFMQSKLSENVEDNQYYWSWRNRAYAAWLLTRQGVPTSAVLINLRDERQRMLGKMSSESNKQDLREDLGSVYLAAGFQILKQDAIAKELLEPGLNALLRVEDYRNWSWYYYYDPLVHHAGTIAIVAKYFPQNLSRIPVQFWERAGKIVRDGYYQSHSAALLLLAVDGYTQAAKTAAAGKVGMSVVDARGVAKALELPKQFVLAQMNLPLGSSKIKLSNQGELPLFYSWAESGYEKSVAQEAKFQGIEIIHEFLDDKGKVINEAELGQEVTVRIRVRSQDRPRLPQVALVDVLPGGLEPVLTSPSDSEEPDVPLWRKRLGGKSTWQIQYADIREDRVVFYGDIHRDVSEVTYKVRATNVGNFVVPAAYGEAMYEHRVYGRSAGASFKVRAVAK
jgi:uncharacterized protein YfaS (alpha-2-macroglobulin family)